MPEDLRRTVKLKSIQNWMKWVIVDPRGVKAALLDPRAKKVKGSNLRYKNRYLAPTPDCRSEILASGPGHLRERLDVYAEGYFIRLRDHLKSIYSASERILGANFRDRVILYLKRRPSLTYSLNAVGKDFGLTVQKGDPPFLRDLIKYEWLQHELNFLAEPSPRISQLGTFVTVWVHPGVRFLRSYWDIPEIVRGGTSRSCSKDRAWLFFRRSGVVNIFPVVKFFQPWLCRGQLPLKDFLELTIDSSANPMRVRNLFKRWTGLGLLQVRSNSSE